MIQPQGVKQAVIAIWITLLIFGLSAVANKYSGAINPGEFFGYLITYGLFCIFPYKIAKGSNPSRYIYTILTVMGFLMMAGGIPKMPKLDWIISIILIPVDLFIIYKLFSGEANSWFNQPK